MKTHPKRLSISTCLPKKTILFLVLVIFSNDLYSQKITLNELVSFVNKDFSSVNDYLLSKNWIIESTHAEGEYKAAKWLPNLIKDDAGINLIMITKHKDHLHRVEYQTDNKEKYLELLTELNSLNPSKSLSVIKSKGIVTEYRGKSYVYQVENSNNFYRFLIFSSIGEKKEFKELLDVFLSKRDTNSRVDSIPLVK